MKYLILFFLLTVSLSAQPTKTTGKIEPGTATNDMLLWDNTNVKYINTPAMGVPLKSYGLTGDNSTDDLVRFNNAITDAKASVYKTLVLYADTFYVSAPLDITGLNVIGNGAMIRSDSATIAGFIQATATYGSFDTLTVDAHVGDNRVVVGNLSFTSGLVVGDLIKIVTDSVYDWDASEPGTQGESFLVRSVDGLNIYTSVPLHDNYYATNNARVQKIEKSMTILKNVTIMGAYVDNYVGILFKGIYKPIIDNVTVLNAYVIGIQIKDCYAPIVRATTNVDDKVGLGYGIRIGDATMYADISGQYLNARHSFTAGGSAEGGVPWEAIVHDAVGTSYLGGSNIFDTHAGIGSIVFDNCTAIGGLLFADTSSFKSTWDASITYSIGDIAAKDNWYYKSVTNSNVGNNPTTDDFNNWVPYSNGIAAFSFRSRDVKVINCTAKRVGVMYQLADSHRHRNMIVKNLSGYNVNIGVNLNENYSENTVVDGLYIKNDYVSSGFAITTVVNTAFNNTIIENVITKNIRLVSITKLDSNVKHLTFTNLKGDVSGTHTNYSYIYLQNIFTNLESFTINGLEIGHGGGFQLIYVTDTTETSTNFYFNDVKVDSLTGYLTKFDTTANIVKFNNLRVSHTNAQLFYFPKGVHNLIVDGIVSINSTIKPVFVTTGKTFGKAYINGWVGHSGTPYQQETPTIEVVQGDFNYPNVIKGSGDPNGSITGSIGEMYMNRTYIPGTDSLVYYNTTGSTIWKGK